MKAAHHRVWPYAAVAWATLVVIPITYHAARWQMHFGRDPDVNGVSELVSLLLFIFTVPMAALAFLVFAPLAIAADYIIRGRTSRLVNALFGAALALPANFVSVFVTGWPEHTFDEIMAAFRHPERAPAIAAATLLAGTIVGLGLRHSRPAPPARPQVNTASCP